MTSSINPNNIDSTFPIAGQDNDSQGFRDNFTNIKTNLTYAKTELEDLQSKAVLKSALSGSTLINDLDGNILKSAEMTDMRITRLANGQQTGALAINVALAGYQSFEPVGSVTLSFTDFAPAGALSSVRLSIEVTSTANTVILPAGLLGTRGVVGLVGNTLNFTETGTYDYEFSSSDGGATITLVDLTQSRDNVRLSVSNAANGNLPAAPTVTDISLDDSVTYFTTNASAAALGLADGVAGQTKTLIMQAHGGGDATLTINSTDTGTVVFTGAGQTLSLVFAAGKWYVTGSYGCTIN